MTSQVFLSAFVIFGYENDVIDNERKIISQQYNINKIIIKTAKAVVESIDSFSHEKITIYKINKFSKLLITYKTIFEEWKIKDHNQLIHVLTTSYYEIENMIQSVFKM